MFAICTVLRKKTERNLEKGENNANWFQLPLLAGIVWRAGRGGGIEALPNVSEALTGLTHQAMRKKALGCVHVWCFTSVIIGRK
jgi:hypothetical protein